MNKKKQNITDLKTFQSAALSLQSNLKERGDAPELPIKSMPDLSYKLWGLHKRKMLIIGARTSNGKSVMAINIAWDLVKQRKNVIFLSLEMPVERIMERVFCLECGVNNIELLANGYNKHADIRAKYEKFRNNDYHNFILSDCIGKDWGFVDNLLVNIGGKPDAIFIDHIQEIRGSYSQKQAVDDYLSRLRESAIRHNFALVICSQINRIAPAEKEDKEPQLHHLKSCVVGETLIDGYKIKDIVNKKIIFPINTYDVHKRKRLLKYPDKYIKSGKQKCIKIKTEDGKEIVLSEKTMIHNGKIWKTAKEYKVGEKILVEY